MVAAGDTQKWLSLHKHAREVRLVRGLVLLGEVLALALAAARGDLVPAGAVAAHRRRRRPGAGVGGPPRRQADHDQRRRPGRRREADDGAHRPRARRARHRRDEQGDPRGRDKAIVPIDPPMRDGPGWLARLDLPHGVTAGAVSEKREEFASGLRRPLGCVWPETDHKRHPGALNLYVADEDMTTAEQPRLAAGQARRGRHVQAAGVRLRPARPGGHGPAHVRLGDHRQRPADGQDLPAAAAAADLRARRPRRAAHVRPEGNRRPGAAAPGGAPLPGRRRPGGHRVHGGRLPRAADGDAAPHQGHPRHRRQAP